MREYYNYGGHYTMYPPWYNERDVGWVNPHGEKRTKSSHPYSYDEFFIFGDREIIKTAKDAVYSDRMVQWYHDKYEKCAKEINKRWDQMGEKDVSKFMTLYYDKPIEAIALAEGCNISNGYPYWIIWFKDKEK